MPEKCRLDALLVETGLVESRQKAQALILEGLVFVENQRVDKVAQAVLRSAQIQIRGNALPYVSRGGLKLEKALLTFPIALAGKVCLDVGASTGGFTDCMLQNGASKVYSIDVGYGQLDWKLRNDQRVVTMERRNARAMAADWFTETPDFASMDVSFISIRKILPALYDVLSDQAELLTLIKPQFEAGREHVGKHGVVRSVEVRQEVIQACLQAARALGFAVRGLTFSPITGPKGNVEFLLYAQKGTKSAWPEEDDQQRALQCAQQAAAALEK